MFQKKAMKYKLHASIGDYEFVEIEVEGGVEEVFKEYSNIKEGLKKHTGITTNKLLELIDAISIGNPGSLEDFQELNHTQNLIVQAVKRAYNRSSLAKSKVAENKFKKDLK